MPTNADIKDLILILNMKAEKSNTKYALEYHYDYSAKFKKMFCKTYITKFVSNKLQDKINITGGCVYVIQYLAEEMKLYT